MSNLSHFQSADNTATNPQTTFSDKAKKEIPMDDPSGDRLVLTSAPALAKALAGAQQRCRAANKDARNNYHGYKYASAEAIISEAKDALADSGLSLAPTDQRIADQTLTRRFLLLHESGESVEIVTAWPVVPERGRPIDKAVATAATTSLAYLLRDLLLMPRLDSEDDLPARQDKPSESASKAPRRADGATDEQLTKMREYRADLGIGPNAWMTILSKRGVASARDLTTAQAEELVKALSHRVATKQLADGFNEGEQKGGIAEGANSKRTV
jgi:hypothetical protein